MFEDEVDGFLQELKGKARKNPKFFPAYLLIEDEGQGQEEELRRILDRMGIAVKGQEERGLFLNVRIEMDQEGHPHFFQGKEEVDFHPLYFVLRRNGLIRIDTLQASHPH